ncbi:MAG: penicillin-binding protein 2 [Candidatus Parcubacteria bacterium]|nr:penicillin-binding protein 2 [Candidatus Parcubacteria bacterium]
MNSLFVKRQYRSMIEIDDFSVYDNDWQINGSINIKESDFIGKFLTDKKIGFFLICIIAVMVFLSLRSFQLQILKGSYYEQIAEANRTQEKPLIATRGLIFDVQKKLLVKNIPYFDALIVPKDLKINDAARQEQVKKIATALNVNEADITTELAKHPKNFKYPIIAKENIDYEQAMLLKIKAGDTPGYYVDTHYERQYLYPNEFSHIIGYEGKITENELKENEKSDYLLNDYLGKTGLEAYYEEILRGKYGQDSIEVDVSGQEKKVIAHQEPENGKNLILSIDAQVQQKVREILVANLRKFNKTKASVVMINPQNGEILSLISYPDFDNNLFSSGISREDYANLINDSNQPLFDRAIKGEYPSGSSIKPAVALGALQEKIITDKTTFMSSGGLWLYDRWFFPDWAAGGHGVTNVYKAIAWSVNTFFYIIGGGYNDFKGLGPEGLEKYFVLFGFGQKTNIDLPGEASGLVPNPLWKMQTKKEQWYIGDTYHMAIGQGDVLVTPLQIANLTATIANGGTLYQPHIVKEFFPNNGQSEVIKPVILRENFIDKENIEIVKKAMRQTVTIGSATLLNNLDIAVSGKTGTAQWNTEKNNHAWFTGFAPYEDPQVAITVLVEEGGEGSAVSVPITYDILNWYFNVYKK